MARTITFERWGRTKEQAVAGLRSEYHVVSIADSGRRMSTPSGDTKMWVVTVTPLPIGVGKGKRMPGPGEDWR